MPVESITDTQMEIYEFELRRRAYAGLSRRLKYQWGEDEIAKLVQRTNKGVLQQALKDTSPEDLHKFTVQTYTPYKQSFIDSNRNDFPGRDKRFSLASYIERLEYELKVIKEMGFNSYFLIVSEYVRWGKEHQISVGPGRGSGAGSLLAWLVGITEVDPLPFDLLFERFLNPARVSMPDFDIDFEDSERQTVIQHCYDLYGAEKVCSIGTFMKMATKASFKDVARTLGVPFEKSNTITNLLQDKMPLISQVEDPEGSPELKFAYDTDAKIQEAMQVGDQLTGNLRQMGVHACGIIIAPEKVTTYTPTQYKEEGDHTVVSQYDGPTLESIGLLKMDFLGLRNLSIIKNCVKIIKARADVKGEELPEMFKDFLDTMSLDIPIDDEETYKRVFQQGDTTGIFQFESQGMRKYLIDLIPDKIDNLVAMNALYRPGPMDFIPSYIARKNGKEEIEYMYPDLKAELIKKYGIEVAEEERKKLVEDLNPFLKETYGIAVYQEQLMFLVQAMAGFSLGEADLLRRGVGKKKKYVIEQLKKEFVERGASYHNYKPETTTQIYEKMIEPAASYSFNKSHSVCYAMIAYQTAYLKVHYPIEFSAALVRSVEEDVDTQSFYFSEIQQSGIDILQPDINISYNHVAAIDETVRIGFISIKGVGFETGEAIQEERKKNGKYTSLEDFCKRCSSVLNRKSLEGLIKSGALDSFGDRKMLWDNIEIIIDWITNSAHASHGLFGDLESKIPLKNTGSSNLMDKLMMEQEVFKTFISGNPLDGFYKYIKKKTILSNIKDKTEAGSFEIIGYIKEIRRAKKKGFFVTIEDISDSFDIFLSETYGFSKFDIVIVQGWKKTRIQVSKITKTSREILQELAGGLYDEKDTVAVVKKARASEEQQIRIERMKSAIATENSNTEYKKNNIIKESKENEIEEYDVEGAEEPLYDIEDIEINEEIEVDSNENEINKTGLIEDDNQKDFDGEQKIFEGGDNLHNQIENTEGKNGKDSKVDENMQHEMKNENMDGASIDVEKNIIEKKDENNNEKLVLSSNNVSFSKMMNLSKIIAGNPGNIEIEVFGKIMRISEKGVNDIQTLLNE